jgi:hypothetical protein
MAEAYMADRLKRQRSEVHRDQWRQTLRDYAYPVIVRSVKTRDFTTNICFDAPMHGLDCRSRHSRPAVLRLIRAAGSGVWALFFKGEPYRRKHDFVTDITE